MNAWWRGLTVRERIIVAVGAGLLALLACFQFVFSPIMGWRAESETRAERAAADYQLVRRAASLAQPGGEAPTSDTPIRNALTDLAARYGVPLVFVNALSDGSVEMQGGPADPAAVFELFATLESEEGVTVTVADIARAVDDPSKVRLQATLARPN